MEKFIVNLNEDGKKLNTVLTSRFPELKISDVYKALRKKDIRINGVRVKENTILHKKDEVLVFISDEILHPISNISIPPIIYEDDNIVVFNKPDNMEVTGDGSLTELAQKIYPFIEPCHRIDRNTKGLVLFSKKQEVLTYLLQAFKKKEIEKHYLAKVYGIPKEKQKTIISYLFKDRKKSMVYVSDTPKTGYQKAITKYTVFSSSDAYSILDVVIPTGRTHQIRAVLSHIGYPIIGDGKYGKNEINKIYGQKTQMLCSYILTFHFSNPPEFMKYLNEKQFILDKKPF